MSKQAMYVSTISPLQSKKSKIHTLYHDKKTLNHSDLILNYLENIGVKYVFGIPGGAIQPFYNALARSEARNSVQSVLARHETGSSFMADGYTRETGILGVCVATTGPGCTNLITGAASAYENEIPQLIITAQTALSTFGKGAFQESSCTGLNILGMFQHCTRYNSLVSHPGQLEQKLIAAIMTAYRSPRGPVHLSIPMDILSAPLKGEKLTIDFKPPFKNEPFIDNHSSLQKLYEEIKKAEKSIVFVLGSGCNGITNVVLELANLLQAKIVTSADGKGLVSAFHPQYRGVFGFAGHASAADTLKDPNVRLVIAIGTNFSEWASGGWDKQALMNDRLIHIDSVEKHFNFSPMAKMHIIGSIANICLWLVDELMKNGTQQDLTRITKSREYINAFLNQKASEKSLLLPNCIHQNSQKYIDESTPIKPQKLMYELGTRFPPSTRFLADTGNSCAWAIHYLHPIDRRMDNFKSAQRHESQNSGCRKIAINGAQSSTFRLCVDFASMGWAIGASIGTAVACKDNEYNCPVVCITGDGSVLMSGQEITVALMEELTVIYVILNDQALGMVKHGQRLAGEEAIAYELPRVNFQQMAESMGIEAFTIKSPEDFQALDIDAICNKKAPTLLDVHIDAEEIPPIGMRIQTLDAATKSPTNKDND